jgi:hypothetical protein
LTANSIAYGEPYLYVTASPAMRSSHRVYRVSCDVKVAWHGHANGDGHAALDRMDCFLHESPRLDVMRRSAMRNDLGSMFDPTTSQQTTAMPRSLDDGDLAPNTPTHWRPDVGNMAASAPASIPDRFLFHWRHGFQTRLPDHVRS